MTLTDPYQAYAEATVVGSNPVRLVVALYEGAVDAVREARQCLRSGDIMLRSRNINKAVKILTELLVSIDQERGGEIGGQLKSLYAYMQSRILAAHCEQSEAPLKEVEGLLTTLLEAWQRVADTNEAESAEAGLLMATPERFALAETSGYASYFADGFGEAPAAVFCF